MKIGFLTERQFQIIRDFHRKRSRILLLDLRKKLPFSEKSVSVIYSSHLIEHLSYKQALDLISECYRVLQSGGILRVVTPDLGKAIEGYLSSQRNGSIFPANDFLQSLGLGERGPQSPSRLLVRLFRDDRHRWLYDGKTLQNILKETGFEDVQILSFGASRINEVGTLDVPARRAESLYVEGERP